MLLNRITKFLLVASLLWGQSVLAQESEPSRQTLLQQLDAANNAEDKIKALAQLAELTGNSDYAASLEYANKGIQLAETHDLKAEEAELLQIKAATLTLHAEWAQSNEMLQQAQKIYQQTNDLRNQAKVWNMIGTNLYRLGQISSALEDSEKALAIAQENGYKEVEANALLSIGRIYARQKDYRQALNYYRQNLKIYQNDPYAPERTQALNNIADANMKFGQYQSAIDTLNIAIRINRSAQRKDQLIFNYATLGETYEKMQDYDSAYYYADKALNLSRELGNPFLTAYMHSSLAIIFYGKNQFDQALTNLYKALELAEKVKSDEVMENALKTLHMTHFAIGQYDSAYYYLSRYQTTTELTREAETKKTQKLLLKLDQQKRTAEQEAFESKLENDQIRISRLITSLILGGIVLLMILAGVIVLYIQRQKQKEINRELLVKNQEIKKQNASIAQQTDKLQEALENLSLLNRISQKIIVNFSIKDIIKTVNENVASLFINDGFGIGILNRKEGRIEFEGFIEKGQIQDFSYDSLNDDDNLSVYCLTRNQEVIINSYTKEYSKYVTVPKAPKSGGVSESVIYVPLKTKDGTIGVVTLQNEKPDIYDIYSISMVRNLANFVSIAIENAQSYNDIKTREKEIESQKNIIEEKNQELVAQKNQVQESYENIKLLNTLGTEITSHLSVVTIIQTVYDSINNLISADLFSIGIYNEERNTIDMPNTIEKGKSLPHHSYSLDNENRLAVVCFKNVKEVLINDLRNEFREYLPHVKTIDVEVGGIPESVIYIPLIGRGKVLGVLTVQSFKRFAYKEHDINLLRNLAIYITVALENADSYKRIRSINDELAEQKKRIEEANQSLATKNEEIETSYKNIKLLGEIGKGIVTKLSVPKIISTVYKSINTLMDANVFWIGLYDKAKDSLVFEGAYEHGKSLNKFEISIDDDERLAVYCFTHQKEINIRDFSVEYKKYFHNLKPAVAGEHSESIIYVPLTTINKRVGVLTIQSFNKEAYNEYHLNIIRNLAVYTVIALENALLYENLEGEVAERTAQVVAQKEEIERQKEKVERSFKNIQLLSDIGQKITRILSIDQIIETVYENVNNLMDANAFGIGLIDEEQNAVIFTGAMESGEKLPVFAHDMNDQTRYSVWCIENQKEVILNDALTDYKKYISTRAKPVAGEDPNSIIYLPLIYKDLSVGCITVQSMRKHAYDEYHIEILRNLSIYTAIALENAKAYQQIELKSREIVKTNQKIHSSINYAKRIQRAILPSRADLQKVLPDAFVMFKPKDVVSGDFYWFQEKGDKVFLAAVDCTGHGVPGAIMSMIGSVLLSEIVNLMGLQEPDLILNTLHLDIRDALKQENTNNRDGMDISLCVVDRRSRKVEFAGAKQPLVYIQYDATGQPVMHTIKGDKMPIGGIQREKERIFTRHSIQLPPRKPDSTNPEDYTYFYLFSDGYQDQFGVPQAGEPSRKMMTKRMKETFMRNHTRPMLEQHQALDDKLIAWQKKEPQIDDILIIGFRI